MSDVPVQLIVAAFDDEKAADEALRVLKEAKRDRLIGVADAAVLRKDHKGKLHIKETADMGGGVGATIGGVIGAGIGAIAGAALVVPLAVGGLIGGLAAKLRDSGFSDDRLEQIGAGLSAGSSAIIAVVEHSWVEEVQNALAETAADVIAEGLAADIAAQLETHHTAAYSALLGEGTITTGRIAIGDDDIEGAIFTVGDQELVGSEFLATEEGIIVAALAADPDGLAEVVVVADLDDDEADGRKLR